MPLTPGTRLGSYQIGALIGTGAMGEVYRARDNKLDREVAIKVLHRDVAANPAALRRFELEARAASALNHPGIVTIHDVGESDGCLYIVMELVEGSTLRHTAVSSSSRRWRIPTCFSITTACSRAGTGTWAAARRLA